MRYEPNPKHKEPWQRGRRGSLCPKLPTGLAQKLLDESALVDTRRYACHEGQAFCAQEHRPGVWHGYPIAWVEVPPVVKNAWIAGGDVSRSDTKKGWAGDPAH